VGVRLLEQEFVPLRVSLSACFFAPSSLFLLGADSCLLLSSARRCLISAAAGDNAMTTAPR
jgi:hypothetical protein